MPFLPTGNFSTSSIRSHSPVQVRRPKTDSSPQSQKSDTKKKQKAEPSHNKNRDHSDWESIAQPQKSETKKKQKPEFSRNKSREYSDWESSHSDKTAVDIETYLADQHFQPKMGPTPARNSQPERIGERTEYGRGQQGDRLGRQETPRGPTNRQNVRADPGEVPDLDFADLTAGFAGASFDDAPRFPVTAIYNQIHVLRQSGASVKYTPKSRHDYVYDAHQRPQPSRRISTSNHPPDIFKPTIEEMNAIDQALANVINTGAEVEFLPLHQKQPGNALRCDACLQTFTMQRERDEHIEGGSIKCTRCGVQLPCQTMMEEHVHKIHSHRNSQGFSSSDRPNSFGDY